MVHKGIAVAVLVVAAVVATGASTTSSRSAGLVNPYIALPQSIGCGDCSICGGGHEFFEDTDYDHPRSGFNHVCFPISCIEDVCGRGNDNNSSEAASSQVETAITRLVQMARAGDVRGVTRLLDQYKERASVNRQRGALQVTAKCSNHIVIAHVPLSSAQLRAIAAH